MRIALLTATIAATAFSAIPAEAQRNGWEARQEYREDVRDARRD